MLRIDWAQHGAGIKSSWAFIFAQRELLFIVFPHPAASRIFHPNDSGFYPNAFKELTGGQAEALVGFSSAFIRNLAWKLLSSKTNMDPIYRYRGLRCCHPNESLQDFPNDLPGRTG